MTFVKDFDFDPTVEENHRTILTMIGFLNGVIDMAATTIGSKKLGEAFKALAKDHQNTDFTFVAIFSCLLRSKPKDWQEVAREMIRRVRKDAYYLKTILDVLKREYFQEVNTIQERGHIERLIATIQAKRNFGKQDPGSQAITKMLSALRQGDYFKRREE